MSDAPDLRTRADKRLHRPPVDASPRCWCSTVTVPGATGDVLVLRVAGEVDPDGLAILAAALDDVLDRRPDHLVVDLTRLVSCSTRGTAAVARAARVAVAVGIRIGVGGAPAPFARLWPRFWPDGEAPRLHRTTAVAVLSAVGLRADPGPGSAADTARARPLADEHDPAGVPEGFDDADPDRRLGGHGAAAQRHALHRRRSAMHRSALHVLGASYGAHPLGTDLAGELRDALAGLAGTSPVVSGPTPDR